MQEKVAKERIGEGVRARGGMLFFVQRHPREKIFFIPRKERREKDDFLVVVDV